MDRNYQKADIDDQSIVTICNLSDKLEEKCTQLMQKLKMFPKVNSEVEDIKNDLLYVLQAVLEFKDLISTPMFNAILTDGDYISGLDNQISSLKDEVERLKNIISEKDIEIIKTQNKLLSKQIDMTQRDRDWSQRMSEQKEVLMQRIADLKDQLLKVNMEWWEKVRTKKMKT